MSCWSTGRQQVSQQHLLDLHGCSFEEEGPILPRNSSNFCHLHRIILVAMGSSWLSGTFMCCSSGAVIVAWGTYVCQGPQYVHSTCPFPLVNWQLITWVLHGGLRGMHIDCMVVLSSKTTPVSQLKCPKQAMVKNGFSWLPNCLCFSYHSAHGNN